jgi:hypothetical protein
MKTTRAGALPEKVAYTKYFEHDGALRAYANRMMWFGISAVSTSVVLALLLFYAHVQPPTVIRIGANGEASVVSGATTTPRTALGFMSALAASSAPDEQPADIEGRAVVRKFLESYLTYTPTTMEENWANALNTMTHNLRALTLNQLRDQDIVSKVHDDEITSTFRLRSLEPVKGQPWTYVAFGPQQDRVHRPAGGAVQRAPSANGTIRESSKRAAGGRIWGAPNGGRKGRRVGAAERVHGRFEEIADFSRRPREDAYLPRPPATGTPARGDAWRCGLTAMGGALSGAARELPSKRAATFSDGKEREIGSYNSNAGCGGGSPET